MPSKKYYQLFIYLLKISYQYKTNFCLIDCYYFNRWFTERLARNKVCLENAFVTSTGCLNLRGTVRVVNINFEKQVIVRYTSDKWNTISEALCTYVDGSSDGYSDRFGFTIPASNIQIGQRIEFALK